MPFGIDAAIDRIKGMADQWLIDAEATANRIVDRALVKAQARITSLQLEIKEKE